MYDLTKMDEFRCAIEARHLTDFSVTRCNSTNLRNIWRVTHNSTMKTCIVSGSGIEKMDRVSKMMFA